jgi:hypothetical protein
MEDFTHIWRYISPFGGKGALFEAFLYIWRKILCMKGCHVALMT